LFEYTNEFSSILYNSDLVISRSGGTVFEIAYCAKPAILIPLDGSANDHQNNNAKILLQENAAIVLHEKELTSESLLEIINRIMENRELRKELGGKINQFSQKESSRVIAENILNYEK
jgi:UDP-N-acetylglucosamine--N-acetylmuramyl-(pentapeptide) pyrophosphoryl-undecaprenol N-acetylglucosamine transferase